MTEPSTSLVTSPATGELLDLATAPTDVLAAAVVAAEQHRDDVRDFETEIRSVLLQRLDRRAQWTQRVGDPTSGTQFEVTAPSPDAGTEGYDARVLDDELAALVDRRTIDAEGAEAALERTVSLTVRVPFGHDPDHLARTLLGVSAIADVPVRVVTATAGRKVVLRGVKALRKVDGTGRALDRAQIKIAAPLRTVKIKVVRKASR